MGNYLNAYKVDLEKITSLYGILNKTDISFKIKNDTENEIRSKISQDDYATYLFESCEGSFVDYLYGEPCMYSASETGYLFIIFCMIYGKKLNSQDIPFIIDDKIEHLFDNFPISFYKISNRYDKLPFDPPSSADMWPLIGYITNEECKQISEIMKRVSVKEYIGRGINQYEPDDNTLFLDPFFHWIEEVKEGKEDLIITYF